MGQFVSVKQFVAAIPISRVKVYRDIRAGRLPAKRFGKKLLIDYDAAIASLPDAHGAKNK